MLIKGIHHGGISVSNLDKSVEFYQKNFGLKLNGATEQDVVQKGKMKGARMKIAFLQAGDVVLELIQYLSPRGKKSQLETLGPWLSAYSVRSQANCESVRRIESERC